jgi:hypothetical protein
VPAVAPSGGGRAAPSVPAIVILGADTVLAARPATAVQLANACLAAGYSAAVPASWGDELIASACLEALATRGDEATVMCACPRVAERLKRVPSLRGSLLMFVAPPVAAARYLRARAGAAGLTITYVGDCPGAADPAIDRYATPAALMRSLARRGIVPTAQSNTLDPRVERDGRRFYSLAGGVPAPNWVYAEGRGPGVVQPESNDYLAEIAHHVTARDRTVIDIAPRLGCACSGAVPGEPWPAARQMVTDLEPERAVHEVLDHDVIVDVSGSLEPWTGSSTGGIPTLPTTLPVLAGLHDPERKAPTIRRAPPSPVPFPIPSRPARRSGREPAFPSAPLPDPRAPEPITGGPPRPPAPFTAGPPRRAESLTGGPPRPPEPFTGGPPRRAVPFTGGPPRPFDPFGRPPRAEEPVTGGAVHAFDPFTATPAFTPTPRSPYTPTPPAPMAAIPSRPAPEPLTPAPSKPAPSTPAPSTPPSARAREPLTPVPSTSRSVEPITAATFAALRPNQTSPGPITASGLVPPAAPTPANDRVEPITAATFAALRPNQTSPGPITASGLVPPAAPTPANDRWDGQDRRRWDGVERRQGWTGGQPPPRTEPTTHPLPPEPRTGPIRQPARFSAADRRRILGLAVACSAIVASATSVITVRVLSHNRAAAAAAAAATVAPPTLDSAPPPAAPPPALDTVATAPPAAATPTDTPPPAAQPVITGPSRRAPHARRAPTSASLRGAFGTTAPPPIARTPEQQPAPIPAAAPPLPHITESPELIQIRADIAARKHRIDSLAQLVDSLRITAHATQPHSPVTVPTP